MKRVYCIDSFATRLTVDSQQTLEGSITGRVTVTRCGVFDYLDPRSSEEGGTGGVIRVARLPKYVLDRKAQDSLQRVPFQVDHMVFLTPDNMAQYKVGNSGSHVEVNGEDVSVDFTIDDQKGIAAIAAGKDGVSCGYWHGLVFESGTYNGDSYDAYQYNHVALCADPRLGDDLRIQMDSISPKVSGDSKAPPILLRAKDGAYKPKSTDRENSMKKIALDNGIQYDAADEVAVAYAALKTANDAAATALTEAKTALQAEKDAHGATKDLLKAEKDSMPGKVDAAVTERTTIDAAMAAHLSAPEITALKGKSAKDCKLAVIGKAFPDIATDGKADIAIDTLFEAAAASSVDTAASLRGKSGKPAAGEGQSEDSEEALLEKQRSDVTGMATAKK